MNASASREIIACQFQPAVALPLDSSSTGMHDHGLPVTAARDCHTWHMLGAPPGPVSLVHILPLFAPTCNELAAAVSTNTPTANRLPFPARMYRQPIPLLHVRHKTHAAAQPAVMLTCMLACWAHIPCSLSAAIAEVRVGVQYSQHSTATC